MSFHSEPHKYDKCACGEIKKKRSKTCIPCYKAGRVGPLIEDVEFLLDHGVSPVDVARRTGKSEVYELVKILRRNGRHDLIERLKPPQVEDESWESVEAKLDAWLGEHAA